MDSVIVREHDDPWARVLRACARVASTCPGTREQQLAKRYLKVCEDAYRLSEQCRLSKNSSVSYWGMT